MVVQYLLPDRNITFEQLGKLSDWHPGYVVWEAPAFLWLMNQGVHIIDYDVIDYKAWASDGVEGLKKAIPLDEFKWYESNTYNFDKLAE